ncbi:MAG: TolC family protein [Candidatus Wallbacteria bacterium]|nr:TolC family protein [Candidatus Wallbacteria bacterium]
MKVQICLILVASLAAPTSGGEPLPVTATAPLAPTAVESVALDTLVARAIEPATSPAVKLTLPEALARALENNRTLAVRRLDPAIARARLMQEEGAFDDALTLQVQRQHAKNPTASSLAGANVSESDTRTGNLGFRTRLRDGSALTFNANNQRNESNSRFQTLNPSFVSNLSVSLTKPLLRDSGDAATAGVSVAANAVEQARLRLRKQLIDTLAAVERQYWDLVFARQDREVKRFSLEAAKSLLDLNLARRQSGLGSDVQVVEAETTRATRTDDLEVTGRIVADAQEILRRQLSLADVPPGAELVPVQVPAQLPSEAPLDASLVDAFQRRPDRLDAVVELANRDIRLEFLRNQKLPRVDLVASYAQNGLAGGFGSALDTAAGGDFPGYTVGLQVEIPLEGRSARGNYQAGVLEKKQALLNLKAIEDQIQEEVTRAVRTLGTDLRRVEVSRRGAELAQRQLAAAEERYRQGLIANFDLLRFQQDLADARSRALRSVVDAKKSAVALDAATGRLLEARGVLVEEPSESKAPAR